MNLLLAILPFCIAYAIVRAVMHYRAGRKMWMAQMLIISGFMLAVLLYEIWLTYFKNG